MKKEQLLQTFAWFRAKPVRLKLLRALNLLCTGFTYAAFVLTVIFLAVKRDPVVIRLVLTCGVSFVVLSIFRHILNWPRPYEVYEIPPLIDKDTRGNSFPSRHVFSICVIGTSMLYILPPLGTVLLCMAAVLAAARVLSGVHFIRDVAAGAAIGVFSAVAVFALMPH
jgi:membrane-associated phospholipid phosphatase